MGKGFVGEFYVYHLDREHTLLVDPDEEITPNFERYKKLWNSYSENMFRGLRSIVLKENEELIPVKLDNSDEYYEGLYFLNSK